MTIPTVKEYRRPMGSPADWSTNDYLNELMHRYSVRTDYGLHKLLKVSRQTIYRYRDSHGSFDDAVALRVAELLGMEPSQLLIHSARERCKLASARGHWQSLLKKLSGAVVAVLIVSGLLPYSDTPPAGERAGLHGLYIMLNRLIALIFGAYGLRKPAYGAF
jgi:hypothetical protein